MNARLTPMFVVLLLTAAALNGCGSSYSNPMSPTAYPAPSSTPAPAPVAATVTVTIVAIDGALSFAPDPSSIAAAQTVAFYNADAYVHRIAADGGAFDTGNLNPGATSAPIVVPSAGAFGYHDMIYPAMVGTLNVTGR